MLTVCDLHSHVVQMILQKYCPKSSARIYSINKAKVMFMNEKSESFKRNVKKHEKKTREFVHINPIKSEIVVCTAISSFFFFTYFGEM